MRQYQASKSTAENNELGDSDFDELPRSISTGRAMRSKARIPESFRNEGVCQMGTDQEAKTLRWRFCYIVICIGLLKFGGSLALALWRSFTRNDVSGGFTMAAYVVAVDGLPWASLQMRHSQRCNCWRKTQESEREMLIMGNTSWKHCLKRS